MMHDILIKNGMVVDGSGREPYRADVVIDSELIEDIGEFDEVAAQIVIDAKGKFVAPGFIDIQNHSDLFWRLFIKPEVPSLITQGITTMIGGNCGASIAPLTSGNVIETIQKYADIKHVNVDWQSMKDFSEYMTKRNFGVNFGTLTGHGTLRRGVVHNESRPLKDEELKVMERLIRDSLEAGSFGLSLGLAYSHERSANKRELVSLAKIVNEYNAVLAVHLRNESKRAALAIEEAIEIAQDSLVSVEISHLKVAEEENWWLMNEMLDRISRAGNLGLNINFDVYPYTTTSSPLYIFLPEWATEGGKHMLLKRLHDPDSRKKIIEELKYDNSHHKFENGIVFLNPLFPGIQGKRISDMAKVQQKSPEEIIIDLLLVGEGKAMIIFDSLDEENVINGMKHPLSIIVSNGAGFDIEDNQKGEYTHPRSFGAFPRVLGRYVREKKIISIAEAIKKMTFVPAEKYSIKKRGALKRNFFADVVVFDPEKIIDKATVENPFQYSVGISDVIVNGKFALRDGMLTGELNGRFLTRS